MFLSKKITILFILPLEEIADRKKNNEFELYAIKIARIVLWGGPF